MEGSDPREPFVADFPDGVLTNEGHWPPGRYAVYPQASVKQRKIEAAERAVLEAAVKWAQDGAYSYTDVLNLRTAVRAYKEASR